MQQATITVYVAIILFVIALVIGGVMGRFFSEYFRLKADLDAIKDKRRHTNRTLDGLDDATAVTVDAMLELQNLQAEAQFTAQRLGQLQEIISLIRQGPLTYPSDRPAGEKPRRGDN
jgi:low affinity Fe/Cu permease